MGRWGIISTLWRLELRGAGGGPPKVGRRVSFSDRNLPPLCWLYLWLGLCHGRLCRPDRARCVDTGQLFGGQRFIRESNMGCHRCHCVADDGSLHQSPPQWRDTNRFYAAKTHLDPWVLGSRAAARIHGASSRLHVDKRLWCIVGQWGICGLTDLRELRLLWLECGDLHQWRAGLAAKELALGPRYQHHSGGGALLLAELCLFVGCTDGGNDRQGGNWCYCGRICLRFHTRNLHGPVTRFAPHLNH